MKVNYQASCSVFWSFFDAHIRQICPSCDIACKLPVCQLLAMPAACGPCSSCIEEILTFGHVSSVSACDARDPRTVLSGGVCAPLAFQSALFFSGERHSKMIWFAPFQQHQLWHLSGKIAYEIGRGGCAVSVVGRGDCWISMVKLHLFGQLEPALLGAAALMAQLMPRRHSPAECHSSDGAADLLLQMSPLNFVVQTPPCQTWIGEKHSNMETLSGQRSPMPALGDQGPCLQLRFSQRMGAAGIGIAQ